MTGKSGSGKRAERKNLWRRAWLGAALLCLTSCATAPPGGAGARLTTAGREAETPGDYFIGRRYFNRNYRFWGYLRRPGQPWSRAVLVMLNENRKLAPDRAELGPGTGRSYESHAGFDNNYEYKFTGYYSGETVYELVSDRVYPEFVLTGYELLSTHPRPIFPSKLLGRRVSPFAIEKPL